MTIIPADLRGSFSLPPGKALEICHQLEAAILQHRMQPGMELAEDEVGDLFGVSRTVARTALQALAHGGLANKVRVNVRMIDSEQFDDEHHPLDILDGVHGVLLPGGFGERGARGKMRAARFAREKKIPCFGICYGMQLSVVEAARHLADIKNASTTEFGPTDEPVVGLIEEWTKGNQKITRDENTDKGGTMRLGAYPCHLEQGSLVHKVYNADDISERHRHRYEVNNAYRDELAEAGLQFSGTSPNGELVEFVELPADVHPYYVSTQAHPELKSRPTKPHPLFADFVRASYEHKVATRSPAESAVGMPWTVVARRVVGESLSWGTQCHVRRPLL